QRPGEAGTERAIVEGEDGVRVAGARRRAPCRPVIQGIVEDRPGIAAVEPPAVQPLTEALGIFADERLIAALELRLVGRVPGEAVVDRLRLSVHLRREVRNEPLSELMHAARQPATQI